LYEAASDILMGTPNMLCLRPHIPMPEWKSRIPPAVAAYYPPWRTGWVKGANAPSEARLALDTGEHHGIKAAENGGRINNISDALLTTICCIDPLKSRKSLYELRVNIRYPAKAR
jgi:hypothetical protein